MASPGDKIPASLEIILTCLGSPTHYSVHPYPFGYTGFDTIGADFVFLYYTKDDILVELIKPRGDNFPDEMTGLLLTDLKLFNQGGIQTLLDSQHSQNSQRFTYGATILPWPE